MLVVLANGSRIEVVVAWTRWSEKHPEVVARGLLVQENYLPEDIACLEKQMEFLRMTT